MSRQDVVAGKNQLIDYLFRAGPKGRNMERELESYLNFNEYRKPGLNELYFEGRINTRDVSGDTWVFYDKDAGEPDNWKTVTESMEFEYDWFGEETRNPALLRPVMKDHYDEDFDNVETVGESFEDDEEWIGLLAEDESKSGHQKQIHMVLSDRENKKDTVKVFQEWRIPEWADKPRNFVFRSDSDRQDYIKAVVNFDEDTNSAGRFNTKKEDSRKIQGLYAED